mgnify:FL=1
MRRFKMSVYKKLSEARVMLQSMPLKKSGHNKFAGYNYFELGDFLPSVNTIFNKCGICDVISFDNDFATLTIVDIESGGKIEFKSPMALAALKGCHPVQNLGASQTYLRRYLWTTAMGIVEHDALDSVKQEAPSHEEIVQAAVDANIDSLQYIRRMLSDATADNISFAREAFKEMDETTQRQLWVAPSKCSTAFFTTEERRLIKGA